MFRALVCQVFLVSLLAMMTGCNTGKTSSTDKQWRCSIGVSVPLQGKEETYTIDQEERSVILVLGITEATMPIVLAEYGSLHQFLLEIYINRSTTIRGTLLRESWDKEEFHGFFGRHWKLVSGKRPNQEEFHWSGIYRTDGETIYFDVMEKDVVTSTWMMTTKAPRK